MKFKAELQEYLKIVSRLAPPLQGNVTLELKKGKLYLHSSGETNHCSVKVPVSSVEGDGSFAVPLDALRSATTRRESMEFDYKNTMLNIKSGGYKASLSTVDALPVEDTQNKSATKVTITSDQSAWLKSAVSTVSLKPNPLLSSFMPLGVKLGKTAFIACYDSNHMSYLKSNEITGNSEFVLPLDSFAAVLEVFSGSEFDMLVSDSSIVVSNKLVTASMSIPTMEGPSLNDVIELAKQEKAGKSLVFAKEELLAFLENSRAVAVKERSEIQVKVKDGVAILSVTTVNGTVSVKMKVKGTADFRVDFEYFDELVRKAGDNVELTVVGNAFVVSNGKATTLVALNQS